MDKSIYETVIKNNSVIQDSRRAKTLDTNKCYCGGSNKLSHLPGQVCNNCKGGMS